MGFRIIIYGHIKRQIDIYDSASGQDIRRLKITYSRNKNHAFLTAPTFARAIRCPYPVYGVIWNYCGLWRLAELTPIAPVI